MSNLIRIKRGFDIGVDFSPEPAECSSQKLSQQYAVCPSDFPGFTPKLAKREGESVKAGEPLLYDKNDADVCLVSPVSGVVAKIVRGERRRIVRVEVAADEETATMTFATKGLDGDGVTTLLKRAGLWVRMRQRPYDVIPESGKAPRDIFVSAFDSAPMSAKSLITDEKDFRKGVEVLGGLTAGKVYIGCRPDHEITTPHSETYLFDGPHPAGNPGVQIEKIRPVNKGETVWAMGADTVCKIGHLFNNNTLDFGCRVAVGGSCVAQARFIKATEGESLKNLLTGNLQGEVDAMRIVSGNLLTGVKETIDGYLHFPYRTVSVIPEINEEIEFLGWARLGKNKYSFGHTFASWLGSKASHLFDAKINGGERAIIMAGEYDKVQPMDIYSEFLIKAILARDIEKMEQLGIYEVAPEDFALCEFIDTSKLELQRIVREGLDYLRKELN